MNSLKKEIKRLRKELAKEKDVRQMIELEDEIEVVKQISKDLLYIVPV